MKSWSAYGTGVLCLMLLVLPYGCSSKKNQQTKQTGNADTPVTVVAVDVAPVERKNLVVMKTFSGTLEGEEQANIVSKLSERVTGIAARVGMPVGAGQVIINLDKSGTTSQYYQAEANFKNSEKTLQRMKSLYQEGAISLQTLDGAQTAYDVAKANFDAARSAVELSTPISGEVTALNVSLGDLALPGSVLATIARIRQMKVVFNINETDVTSITMGQRVEVYSDAKPELKVEGKIVQLSKSADVRSRSFEIKALFPNTVDSWFKPGMFCRVDLQLLPRENTLVIPVSAIQSDGNSSWVFLVRDGRAFQKLIQTGVTDGDNMEVVQGLQAGDLLATVGVNNLHDSSYVHIVHPSE
jgi:membrane fusion protein (multidrug efflux system)